MASVIIENFRYGLDTRRSNLTSVLGVLTTLRNAHVNQGGEIEKRKSFVGTDITPTPASGVVSTFGMEALRDSIVIFGGEANADAANWPPAGFTYQRLYRNPAADADAAVCLVAVTPNYCANCEGWATASKATGVVFSTVFNNKAFVLATMDDGTICAFYDGAPVTDINLYGYVLPSMTGSRIKFFCELAKAINSTGGDYTADLLADPTANNAGIKIQSRAGRQFSTEFVGTGSLCGGSITQTLISGTLPDDPGIIATGSFFIIDGVQGTGNQITNIKVGTTELLSVPIDFTTDVATTAALVVANINREPGTGYNAVNKDGKILVNADAVGTSDNGKDIAVTVAGKVLIGRCEITFSGTGFTVEYVKVDGTNVLSSTLVFASPTTLSAFVTTMQDNINAGTATHGYVSIARGNTLKLSKKVSSSADGGGTGFLPVSVRQTTAPGGTGNADPGTVPALRADVTAIRLPLPLYQSPTTGLGSILNNGFSENITLLASGGYPPYYYRWVVHGAFASSLIVEKPTEDTTRVQIPAALAPAVETIQSFLGGLRSTKLYGEVTDSENNVARSVDVVFYG